MKQCDCRPIGETELMEASKAVLVGSFDEGIFSREIQQIALFTDRIDFYMQKGSRKSIIRRYSGSRGQNAFTNKVWCCSQPRAQCQMKRLSESELLEAAECLVGESFQAGVATDISRVRTNAPGCSQ